MLRCILADDECKPVSRTCGASLQPTFIPLISHDIQKLHYRAFLIGIYAEVVCSKCGERITEAGQPDVDTNTTLVCPLVLHHTHFEWVYVCRGVAPTDQVRAEVRMKSGHFFGQGIGMRAKSLTFNTFSMITGAPASTSSLYYVGRNHQLVRSYLIEDSSGRCHWEV
jgi:hypothetical protein